MAPEAGQPPAGWYNDPQNEAALRWWDGISWTSQIAQAPGGGGFSPPLIPGSVPAAQQPQPAQSVVQPAASLTAATAAQQPTVVVAGRSRPLAAWWPRAGAFIIDGLISLAFSLPFLIIAVVLLAGIDWQAIDISKSGELTGISEGDTVGVGLALIISLIGSLTVGLTYQPLTMARKGEQNGRTWGMQLLGIRVVREGGEPMNYVSALIRQFLVMGLLYGVIAGLGNAVTIIGGSIAVLVAYLWPLWDAQNRAGQDFICSTHVVKD